MAQIVFANSALSRLAGALTNVATSLTVTGGEGAKFPTLAGGNWFLATLAKVSAGVLVEEIVKVTARASDTFTIVRGQEGTTATTFAIGDLVELRLTRDTMASFPQFGADNTFTGRMIGLTRAQFDSGTDFATTAFVQAALGNFQSATLLGVSATTNLAAADMGKALTGQGGTINLPSAAALVAGAAVVLSANAATTVARNGSDTILAGATSLTSVALADGDFLVLVREGSTTWRAYGSATLRYTAIFAASRAANGYQKIPGTGGGLILQWGTVSVNISSANTLFTTGITWPIAFPTACREAYTTISNCPTNYINASSESLTVNGMNLVTSSGGTGTTTFRWLAIGD